MRHFPVSVAIEPANFCQLHCPQCPVGRGERPIRGTEKRCMSVEDFSWYIDRLRPHVHTVQLFWQGEPLLHPQLAQMVQIAKEADMFTVVSTNAQALTPEMADKLVEAGLHRIIISLDGLSEESYSAYRTGGSAERVIRAISLLRQAKKKAHHRLFPIIEIQMLRLRTNEHEWPILRHNYRRLGADRLVFKTAQFYDYEQGNPLMPQQEKYCRYQLGEDGLYHPKRTVRNHCKRLWNSCVIGVDGTVYPCCYDKLHRYPFGNLKEQTLEQVWYSQEAMAFRKQVLSHASEVDICKNCQP